MEIFMARLLWTRIWRRKGSARSAAHQHAVSRGGFQLTLMESLGLKCNLRYKTPHLHHPMNDSFRQIIKNKLKFIKSAERGAVFFASISSKEIYWYRSSCWILHRFDIQRQMQQPCPTRIWRYWNWRNYWYRRKMIFQWTSWWGQFF